MHGEKNVKRHPTEILYIYKQENIYSIVNQMPLFKSETQKLGPQEFPA